MELDLFNGSALVAWQGQVVFSSGYGLAQMEWNVPNDVDTKFRIGSITKQFTAMLILQLVEEGRFSLDSTVADLLPDYRSDTGSRITVHHLLSHTSGLAPYHRPPELAEDPARDPGDMEGYVTTYCSGELEFEPGSRFRYSNAGYRLLGAIIERTTGKGYEQVLEERIFGPLGMRDTGYDHEDAVIERRAVGYFQPWDGGIRISPHVDMSVPYSAGALYSTVEDLFKWDRALAGYALLDSEMTATMFRPVLDDYAYGWRVEELPIGPDRANRTVTSHSGGINGFYTTIVRVPDDGALVVLFNNRDPAPLVKIRTAILDLLYGREPAAPRPPVLGELMAALEAGGVEAAMARYRDLKEHQQDRFDFSFSQLNRLCYHLMEAGRFADAIDVCKANVESFPNLPHPYDSLGEAYMSAGETRLAIVNYARSLERDPDNTNAVRQLVALAGIE